MRTTTLRNYALAVTLAAGLILAGCAKKAAQATPPVAPPPVAPSATLAANPAVIEQGQSTTLTWQTDNASDVAIDGLGALPTSGSKTVTPSGSMTYTLTATGPGGRKDASARVTVNQKVAGAPVSSPSEDELFAHNVRDVMFDYDKSNIRPDQAGMAQNDAAFLLQHPSIQVVVEGHCDDRGSEEYNLALGTSRAESLKRSLLSQGVSQDRIETISYGKEKPFCTEENDQCWQRNRVDHLSMVR